MSGFKVSFDEQKTFCVVLKVCSCLHTEHELMKEILLRGVTFKYRVVVFCFFSFM